MTGKLQALLLLQGAQSLESPETSPNAPTLSASFDYVKQARQINSQLQKQAEKPALPTESAQGWKSVLFSLLYTPALARDRYIYPRVPTEAALKQIKVDDPRPKPTGNELETTPLWALAGGGAGALGSILYGKLRDKPDVQRDLIAFLVGSATGAMAKWMREKQTDYAPGASPASVPAPVSPSSPPEMTQKLSFQERLLCNAAAIVFPDRSPEFHEKLAKQLL